MATGILWSVIIGLWAAYLVPLWIARHDTARLDAEATLAATAEADGVDHRTDGRTDGQADVQADVQANVQADAAASVSAAPGYPGEATSRGSDPTSLRRGGTRVARLLARRRARLVARRRRTLLGLIGTVLVIVLAVLLGPMPGWAGWAGGVVLAGYLVHLRYQARQSERATGRPRHQIAQQVRARARRRRTAPQDASAPEPAAGAKRPGRSGDGRPPAGQGPRPGDAEEPAGEADGSHRPSRPGLWQPLPGPLPTYVTKPRAVHAVRAIELTRATAWSPARLGSDMPPRWHAASAGPTLSLGATTSPRTSGLSQPSPTRRAVGG